MPKLASRRVAAIAVFAALYALLRLIPISPMIGVRSSLTMGEIFSPLAGMVLGPLAGGASMLIGTFLTAALGRPLVFDGLDFIPGVMAAVTAGLAMKGRIFWSIGLSVLLIVIYTLDPLSAATVLVGRVSVPYLWMHILSVITALVVAWRVGRTDASVFSPLFIVAVIFISTMNAQVSGGIMYENVLVRINGVLTPTTISASWKVIFFLYPFERLFIVIVGSILGISVLRTIPRSTLETLRGRPRTRAA